MRTVGRYALYEKIGSGGMASVHLGRLSGSAGFGRIVAIKRLLPQHAKDPDVVAMLIDEARLTSRIQHPNVVPTLDVVTTEGELFLVMDYVRGAPLSSLLRAADARRERIPPRVVATILASVLHGLHAAHEITDDRGEPLGLVHRDVSPQNVLVGADGVARVLDFGVAKAIGQVHVTRGGDIRGKLAYMAPEHLKGRATRKSDLFSAGVVLWEALTGERLFEAGAPNDTIARILEGNVRPPGEIVGGGDALVARIDPIVLRALAPDPRARFATAREMAGALEREVGVVSPAEVADCVERLAGDELRAAAEKIAAIELAAVPRPAASAATPLTRRARSRAPVLLAAGALLCSALVWPWASRSLRATVAPAERLAAPSGAPVPAPLPREDAPLVEPASIALASGGRAAPVAIAKAPRRPNNAAPAAAQSSWRPCDPPFVYDAFGRKVFKEECLR